MRLYKKQPGIKSKLLLALFHNISAKQKSYKTLLFSSEKGLFHWRLFLTESDPNKQGTALQDSW